MSILLTVFPVKEKHSVSYGIFSFNYDAGPNYEEIIHFQEMIFAQDKPIVKNQKPEHLPLDLQAEPSLKIDHVSIAYRKYLAELCQAGHRMMPKNPRTETFRLIRGFFKSSSQ